MLPPEEIMRRFPVGRILELSQATKLKITFLAHMLSSVDLVQRELQEKFKEMGGMAEGGDINAFIDTLFEKSPTETMVSIAMGNGWNGPESYMMAQQNSNCIRKLIWSVIFGAIVQDYDIDRKTWGKLKLSLLENPPGGGILVKGYDFDEKDFGHLGSARGKVDVCPDFPPSFNEESEDD